MIVLEEKGSGLGLGWGRGWETSIPERGRNGLVDA